MSRVMLAPLAAQLQCSCPAPQPAGLPTASHQTSLQSAPKDELVYSQSLGFIAVFVKNYIDLYQ